MRTVAFENDEVTLADLLRQVAAVLRRAQQPIGPITARLELQESAMYLQARRSQGEGLTANRRFFLRFRVPRHLV